MVPFPMHRSKGSLPSVGGDERILSIVLSSSELAELDLSKLQLFETSAAGNPSSNEAEPVVYKSRGAIEAEKSVEEKKRKGTSMDKTWYDRRPRLSVMQNICRKSEQDLQPAVDPKQEENTKFGIDLKSSPASKFLVPWELQPSPMTPFTPASVPFEWEEAPGKPKERAPDMLDGRSPRPQALHLPPRLLLSRRTGHPQFPPDEAGARHQRSGSAESAEEKRVICVQPTEKHQEDRRPGCLVSSLDYQLAYYSPLRALGPPPPEVLHWGAKASALITMWRKNSSAKHKLKHSPNNHDNMKKKSTQFFYPSGEHLMDGEQRDLTRAQSLNAVIAVAMGAKTKDFNSCNQVMPSYPWGHKSLEPITGSNVYCSDLVDNKTRKRRWVLRKLRRPVRFLKTFFGAVWRVVRLGKSRHRSRGNLRLSYKSLRR